MTRTPSGRDPLAEVASWAPEPQPVTMLRTVGFDIETFFATHGLKIRRGPMWWKDGARIWELETCPFDPAHTHGSAVITQGAGDKLGFKCQHNSCKDRHWRDVCELFEGPRGTKKPVRFQKSDCFGSAGSNTAGGSLTTRCLSDVEAKPVSWLWPGRIACGKLTIIAGNPGLGKSQITASIAAIVTKGDCWPVDRQRCKPGVVVFLSAEDDPADTLRPRLDAAGADLTRVHVVDGVTMVYTGDDTRKDRAFSLAQDVTALGSKLAELGDVTAVMIDPISAYLGDTDSHKNAEVRSLLTPLSELAARHNVAIIGISHLNKAPGAQALMRVTGSLAFVAAARAAYLVTADSQDKTRRLFLPMKNNLGPDATGLAFRIESATVQSSAGPLVTSRVSWESQPVLITADEAVQAESAPKDASAFETAIIFLRETLADGPVTAEQMFDRSKAEGIAKKTLQRASKTLKVQKVKIGMDAGWSWSLPPKVVKSPEGAQVSNVATFAEIDHLQELDGVMDGN